MRYEAKPNISNTRNLKTFDKLRDAINYLNTITGYPMDEKSWRQIGKLKNI